MRLQQVALSEIQGPLCQIRWQHDEQDQTLIESIAENGLVRPLLLAEEEEGLKVVLGTRRLLALQSLAKRGVRSLPPGVAWVSHDGAVEMLALIAEDVTMAQALILAFIDNEVGRALSPFEQCKCYELMVDQLDYSAEEISDRLGQGIGEVQWGLQALSVLPDRALDAWQQGRLSTAHIKQLLKVEDPNLREALLDRALKEELSSTRLSFLVDQLRVLEELPLVERPLFELREELRGDPWIALRMQAGIVGVEDSRKGDRLTLDYKTPEDLKEMLSRLLHLLEAGSTGQDAGAKT